MNQSISELLENLPMAVHNFADAKRLLEKYNSYDFSVRMFKKALERTIALIEPGELLYFIYNTATIKATDRRTGHVRHSGGVAFISDRRILYREDFTNEILIFPLTEIRSVASQKRLLGGNISFCTKELSVEFGLAGFTPEAISQIRDVLLHIIGCCSVETAAATAAHVQVIECPGCAAAVILMPGRINHCEYCDRPVS